MVSRRPPPHTAWGTVGSAVAASGYPEAALAVAALSCLGLADAFSGTVRPFHKRVRCIQSTAEQGKATPCLPTTDRVSGIGAPGLAGLASPGMHTGPTRTTQDFFAFHVPRFCAPSSLARGLIGSDANAVEGMHMQ